jgi:iron(III) transport system substrate-binding protein
MRLSRLFSLISCSILIAGVLVACGGSTGNGTGNASNPSTPKSITVYAALTTANGQALAKAFEAYDPGTTVNMVTGGTGVLVSRIQSEQKAGGVHADVLLLADPTTMAGLGSLNILSTYKPAAASKLPASFQGQNWAGAFEFNNVILYHKGMSLPVPQTWQDLTSSAYHNQLELGDPSYSGTTLAMVSELSQQYQWSYFSTLKKNGALTVQSTNTVGTDVAAGRVDVGITLDSVANSLVAQGSPVQVVWPKDGAIPVPAPVSIVSGHDNSLSEKFDDWLFSSSGQQAINKLGYASPLLQSNLVPAGTKQTDVNWQSVTQDRDNTIKQFSSIF